MDVVGFVEFGDGSKLKIRVVFKFQNGEHCVLMDVSFIPHLWSNTASIGKLMSMDARSSLTTTSCTSTTGSIDTLPSQPLKQ